MSLLKEINQTYLKLHIDREEAFWGEAMSLNSYQDGEFETNEMAMKNFITDAQWLQKVRQELERNDLNETERFGLEGWKQYFSANVIESDEAKAVLKELIRLEGELGRQRRDMKLGYVDPHTQELVEASSVKLGLITLAEKEETMRKAAWEGLRSIETFVLDNHFIDIVKTRNQLGRLLGYDDFYDYRVQVNEGFSKKKLFEILDELAEKTKEACRLSVEAVKQAKGESAIEPWNFAFETAGELTAEKDPYLQFESSLQRWGESFAALGIKYRDAELQLDLVDRKGKYSNGFMHGPFPAFMDENTWRPAKVNFTANAVPGQVGSGQRALETFFHEGGHAAHFANIIQPAPCFSQEFAPSSVAFAETQSMFLDSLVNDPDWLTRYATDKDGHTMPMTLIKKIMEEQHVYRAHELRKMLVVCYFEKALYEMNDSELTPEHILEVGRAVEKQMLCQPASGRPILSIPHLLDREASAYYHGYVLAQMAVYQTRAFFIKRDGYLMDNPKIGPDLAEYYWKPGNSMNFLELIPNLTGEPFSVQYTVDLVNQPLDEMLAQVEQAIANEKTIPRFTGTVDLQAVISMIHGDTLISKNNESFARMSEIYAEWIRQENAKVS